MSGSAPDGKVAPHDRQLQLRKRRTVDVTTGAGSFEELLLPGWLLNGLHAAGFMKPSPVQTAAIPVGRTGSDLIVQAKSGTGKTLVFSIICLDKIRADVATPQALILAPTHEIALQSAEVLTQLSAQMPAPGISIGVFIGGLPIAEDQKLLRRRCQIAVGTPGRVCRLFEIGALLPKNMQMLVLDEADHLMSDSFIQDIRRVAKDVLPKRKQILALSATYSSALLQELEGMMSEPHHVMLCPETVSLVGVRQFYLQLPGSPDDEELLERKIQGLLRLLASTTFHQALVFCNAQDEAQQLSDRLCQLAYPAAFVSGAHHQVDRMDTMAAVHDLRVRVIVATDLASRGLDMENVNLVANLDLPYDAATYMHRVGRTGRFGTHGVAVTFACAAELERLQGFLQDVAGGQIQPLPEHIPEELYTSAVSEGLAIIPQPPHLDDAQGGMAVHGLSSELIPADSCGSTESAAGSEFEDLWGIPVAREGAKQPHPAITAGTTIWVRGCNSDVLTGSEASEVSDIEAASSEAEDYGTAASSSGQPTKQRSSAAAQAAQEPLHHESACMAAGQPESATAQAITVHGDHVGNAARDGFHMEVGAGASLADQAASSASHDSKSPFGQWHPAISPAAAILHLSLWNLPESVADTAESPHMAADMAGVRQHPTAGSATSRQAATASAAALSSGAANASRAPASGMDPQTWPDSRVTSVIAAATPSGYGATPADFSINAAAPVVAAMQPNALHQPDGRPASVVWQPDSRPAVAAPAAKPASAADTEARMLHADQQPKGYEQQRHQHESQSQEAYQWQQQDWHWQQQQQQEEADQWQQDQAWHGAEQEAAAAPIGRDVADGNSGSIAVTPELLTRYYRLEAFAAEYYAWFCANCHLWPQGYYPPG